MIESDFDMEDWYEIAQAIIDDDVDKSDDEEELPDEGIYSDYGIYKYGNFETP